MNGTPKYSDEAVEILTRLERIDVRQEGQCAKIDDIHKQVKIQWEKIDGHDHRITSLEIERSTAWKALTIVGTACGVVGGLLVGFFELWRGR